MSQCWMVSYDIADDGRRRRISEILEGHGARVQWSVFECHLAGAELEALRGRLTAEIDPAADSLRWYPLCLWCRERLAWQGPGGGCEDPPYVVI